MIEPLIIIATVTACWYGIGLLAAGGILYLTWLDGEDVDGNNILRALTNAWFGLFTLVILFIGFWGDYVTPWIEEKLKNFRKRVYIKGRQ